MNAGRGKERRGDPRIAVEYRVQLVVSLHGFDENDRRVEAAGVTVNLSHHGALVRVDAPLTEGQRCLVHLPGTAKRVGRNLIYGTVRRSRSVDGGFEIAVEFDTRLHGISVEE